MNSKSILISLIVLLLMVTLVLSIVTYNRVDLTSKGKQVESTIETNAGKGALNKEDINKDLMDRFNNKLRSL